jgi:hypothetical protein
MPECLLGIPFFSIVRKPPGVSPYNFTQHEVITRESITKAQENGETKSKG